MRTLPSRDGSKVTVSTYNRVEIAAVVQATPGGFVLRASDGTIIPHEQVASVVETRTGRGALQGFGLGMLFGVSTGVFIGLAGGDSCDEGGECMMSARETATILGFALGMLGGGVGALIGGFTGSDDVYSFGAQQPYRITPSGPPGSVIGATLAF